MWFWLQVYFEYFLSWFFQHQYLALYLIINNTCVQSTHK
jgi:hypothetical protein